MDAEQAARAWVDGWTRAWPEKDADAIAALYTEDAVYRSHPFREPHRGGVGAREYARWAFESEESVEVWFAEPLVSGDRAAVEYWAILRSEGKDATLAGTTLLRFAPDGRCEEHREYWALEEGRRLPPDGWGR